MLAVARRLVGRVIFGLLVAFHVWLFCVQFSEGRLLEAAVAFRWVTGACLLAGFLVLRRLGASLVWGRKAVGLWLLVILLHCHAAAAPAGLAPGRDALAEAVAVVVVQVSGAAALVAFGLTLLVALGCLRGDRARGRSWPLVLPPGVVTSAGGYVLPFSPRPPPVA